MDQSRIAEMTQWFEMHLVLGMLVFTRLSLLLMSMPAVGVGVPRRVRALLAILITALLLPTVASFTPAENMPEVNHLIDMTIALAHEGLLGMMIGSTVQLIITGLQLGGGAITSTGGMQLGDAIDPSTIGTTPAIARMVALLATAIMLGVGGHRMILHVLMDSFHAMPAGDVYLTESMMSLILGQLASGMAAGVRLAAPVVAALLLSNLVTGLISRTLPQINLLAIGLSINALVMMSVMALSIGAAGFLMEDEISKLISRFSEFW